MSRLINITDYSNETADISLRCEDQQEDTIFWACITAVSSVFWFPGAVAILMDFFQRRRKGIQLTPIDVFTLNILFMDWVHWLFLQPVLYNYLHGHNLVYELLISFLYSFSLYGKPLFVTCISLDCYLAVFHPVTYRARKSLTPRVLMAVGVWTVIVADGAYFLAALKGVVTDFIPIVCSFVTFPIAGFCDISILWTLTRPSPGGRDIHPKKKRAHHIILSNIVVATMSCLPLIITLLVSHVLSLDETTIRCLVVIPVLCTTVIPNTVSVMLYLNNLGKLDWLKCWRLK